MNCVICGKPTVNELETCSIDCHFKLLKFQGKKIVLEEMEDGSFYLHEVSIDYKPKNKIVPKKERKRKIKDYTAENRCWECGKSINKPFASITSSDHYKICKSLICSSQCADKFVERNSKWCRDNPELSYEIQLNEEQEVKNEKQNNQR